MHQELQLDYPTLSKNEAYHLSRMLSAEGVWNKNIHKLIRPDETNIESVSNNYKIKTAISLILSNWEIKNRILVISDETADSVAANTIITKVLRMYGADLDYKVVRSDYTKKHIVLDSTNGDYINTDYKLIIGIGSITHLELRTDIGKKKKFDIIIDDSPIPAFELKHKEILGSMDCKTKEFFGKIYAYPKCKVYVNPMDPEIKTNNREQCKATLAYKIMEAMIERKQWDKEDLEGCLTLQTIGLIAAEKKMFFDKTQCYENRYYLEKGKSEMTNTNSIWLLAMNEVKQTRKWERTKIEKTLTRMMVSDGLNNEGIDIIDYFMEDRVGNARTTTYSLLAELEARKEKMNKQSNDLLEKYKEDARFANMVFAKSEYVNCVEYTRLLDANNKNAAKLNKVAVLQLTTTNDKTVIVISTPEEVKNELFIGFLMIGYGKVQRRGRAFVLAVDKDKVLTLLNVLNKFIEKNEETIFIKCHSFEIEEISDAVLNVIQNTGMDLTLYANRNEIELKDTENINGSQLAQVKRGNKSSIMTLWNDVKFKRPLEENEKVDIYYKLDMTSKNKKHRIVRIKQFEQ